MPTKRKFTARFPTTRIKKIMQLDEDIGKVTATVPPVVSRALELFMEQLITRAYALTANKNSRTISPSCIKHIIDQDETFGFLRNLVSDIPEFKPSQSKQLSSVAYPTAPTVTDRNSSTSDSDSSSDEGCVSSTLPDFHRPPETKCKRPYKRRKLVEPTNHSPDFPQYTELGLKSSSNDTSVVPKQLKKRGRPKKEKTVDITENLSTRVQSVLYPPVDEVCGKLVNCNSTGV
ncbi:hypothetical protein P879_08673 [Paragonimus westermani]|uniref:Transcription factor CBF/NF-Y/archaeal histone domain-containing protein n=1 Tax=Paragonimus westermani TaxID=34504 RepID=A0A8T0DHW3_9TREM|nr:hypothetical protein P879_08673 [Paragonimus westermani]